MKCGTYFSSKKENDCSSLFLRMKLINHLLNIYKQKKKVTGISCTA